MADSAGTAIGVNAYDEYGIPAAANIGRFQYTGQAWMSEIGLYHYKARFYSPTLGRFLQTDPVGYEDDINLYAYVGNDPVNVIDPSGMRSLTINERTWAQNLGLDLRKFQFLPAPDWIMNKFHAAATTFPAGTYFANAYYRGDFTVGSAQDRSLFYHEIFHVWQTGQNPVNWSKLAMNQVSGKADYKWNDKLSWSEQNAEAQAGQFGTCAGSGQGCSKLEGQSISNGKSTLSFSKGTFTLKTSVTGSRIPRTTHFKAPKEEEVEKVEK